jgi:alpha-N-arabinofuranosidase
VVNSQGAAFVHNLIAGRIYVYKGETRLTPYQKAHSTEVAALAPNKSGDDRFYNNILAGKSSLAEYDKTVLPVFMDGNVYLTGAKPGKAEPYPLVVNGFDPGLRITSLPDNWFVEMQEDKTWADAQERKVVTTELLGRVVVPDLPFEQFDGKPYFIDRDYFGAKMNTGNPFPGPFALKTYDTQPIRVWPKN